MHSGKTHGSLRQSAHEKSEMFLGKCTRAAGWGGRLGTERHAIVTLLLNKATEQAMQKLQAGAWLPSTSVLYTHSLFLSGNIHFTAGCRINGKV